MTLSVYMFLIVLWPGSSSPCGFNPGAFCPLWTLLLIAVVPSVGGSMSVHHYVMLDHLVHEFATFHELLPLIVNCSLIEE